MKSIIKYSIIAVGVLFLSNCSNDEVEVVKFDDSFIPVDPVEKERATPPSVNLLDNFAYILENESTVSLKREDINADVFIDVKVSTNRKVTEDLSYHLEINQEWLLNNPKLNVLSENSYAIESQILASGQKDGNFRIQLKQDQLRNLNGTYYIPLKIVADDKKLNVLKEHDKYLLKIIVKKSYPIPNGDNITVIESATFPEDLGYELNLSFESNYYSNHLFKLNDDSFNQSWWVNTNNPNIYLGVNFIEATVKAIKFTINNRSLRSLNVSVSNDSGITWKSQGNIITNGSSSIVYIKFNEPVDIDAIKLTNFGADGQYVDINELEVFANPE